jgi:hypothetical protein
MKEGLSFLLREPENKFDYAIDKYWKKLQKKDNWHMLIPATVSQLQGYSDIEEKYTNYHHLMLDIDKKYMFNSFLLPFQGLKNIQTLEEREAVENYPLHASEKSSSSALRSEEAVILKERSVDKEKKISRNKRKIEKQEHKKKFAIVLMTIHLIPLFYSIRTFFDFIKTESELNIENLIKICKREWRISEYDFSRYSFANIKGFDEEENQGF